MKIISKKRDYYDSLQEHDGIIYVRDDKTNKLSRSDIEFLESLLKTMPSPRIIDSVYSIKAIVLFCGSVYPIYSFHKNSFTMKGVKIYCSQMPSEVDIILRDKFSIDLKPSKRYSFLWGGHEYNDQGMIRFQNHIKTLGIKISDLFYKTGSPVITVSQYNYINQRGIEVSTKTPLIDFGFQSIIPPFEAYQMIKHFMSNDLVHEPLDDFKLSDNLMRDSKGFDKYSFRKMKEK